MSVITNRYTGRSPIARHRLKAMMKAQRLQPVDLCIVVGRSERTLQRYLSGELRTVPDNVISALADELRTDAKVLKGEAPWAGSFEVLRDELRALVDRLPARELGMARRFMESISR
ncbi:MAG: helix-turn-helix domain-containing protein [Candidatus Xenobiia bacterium LiM19]